MKGSRSDRKALLLGARRVVIKIGSSVLTDKGAGLDQKRVEHIASEVSSILKGRRQVIVVSSGAIAAGLAKLGIKKTRGMPLPTKQAAAAVGQSSLMWMYEKTFGAHGRKVAQVLLTREDLSNRTRFLNARNTFQTLLEYDVIPIVNENDTVAVDEIRFGDNDNLSAMVVHLVDADMLVILSDVDGLYTADPRLDPGARLLPLVEKITSEMERAAGDAVSGVGTGGMRSKIMTAKKVSAYGTPLVIVNGRTAGILSALFEGREVGTLFLPKSRPKRSRKHWIAYIACTTGGLVVDDGGRDALVNKGRSLLPSGVVKIEGRFKAGECVSCMDIKGNTFARGLTKYSSEDLEKIKGLKTSEIERVLGHKDYDEVIHRDDLVIL